MLCQWLSFFFLFSSFIYSNGADNSIAYNCPKSVCHGIEIKYPFWRLDNYNSSSPQYCGYPGFGISCSDQANPRFYLSDKSFYVKYINYSTHSLTLLDIGALDNSTCPRARHNHTLEEHKTPLKFSKRDIYLYFYYNCTHSPPHATLVDCLISSDGRSSYVYDEHDESEDFNWYGSCEDKVVVAVTGQGLSSKGPGATMGAAMGEGFVLDWQSTAECGQCEASDGFCGFNNSTEENMCFCKDNCNKRRSNSIGLKIALGIGATAFTGLIVGVFFFIYHRRQKKRSYYTTGSYPSSTKAIGVQNAESLLRQYGSLAPTAYSYSNIRKMTNLFKEKLGEGGYGGVYKGNLNGLPVAVKILKATKGNGEDFINEVASISRTSHVNIVTLLGFCLNRREKALIYEFMPNGSLDKHIYNKDSKLGWELLYKIAIGIARGLEYLHRGCNARILHFDIKPHNILLDEDFCPKISDFGLAKLCNRKESIMSTLEARGTIGYIAPEVFSRHFGGVSHKSDVYSYGMMVLEMVGGRQNYSAERSHHSEIYFPRWAYQRISHGEKLKIRDTMIDEEERIAKKMILVGLWCIQTNPLQRPAISKVIEMLEGSLEALHIPPKPFICSPSPSEGSSLTNLEQTSAKLF